MVDGCWHASCTHHDNAAAAVICIVAEATALSTKRILVRTQRILSMIMRHFVLVACLLCTSCGLPHREPISTTTSAGQHAKLLAPGVISTGRDYCTTISPDGSTLYFARTHPKTGRDAIYVSTRRGSQWSEPEQVSFSGTYSDTDPLLSPDGTQMFFMSDRPFPGTASGEAGQYDMWVVEQASAGWGTPRHLGARVNTTTHTEGFPSVTADGTLYFFGYHDGGFGAADIFRAQFVNGQYSTPENLGPTINTDAWDGHGYITPDERVLVFYSNKPGGYGRGDLYVSYNNMGRWSAPENLGPAVNTADDEITPLISPDGHHLYFSRIHSDSSTTQRNIYVIELHHTPIAY